MGGHVWRIPYLILHGGPEPKLGVLTVVMKLSLGYGYTNYT